MTTFIGNGLVQRLYYGIGIQRDVRTNGMNLGYICTLSINYIVSLN